MLATDVVEAEKDTGYGKRLSGCFWDWRLWVEGRRQSRQMSYCRWFEEDRSCETSLKSETVNIWGYENIPGQCCMPFKIWVHAFKANIHSCMVSSNNCLELTESWKKLLFIISIVHTGIFHLCYVILIYLELAFCCIRQWLKNLHVGLQSVSFSYKYSTSYDNEKSRLSNRS